MPSCADRFVQMLGRRSFGAGSLAEAGIWTYTRPTGTSGPAEPVGSAFTASTVHNTSAPATVLWALYPFRPAPRWAMIPLGSGPAPGSPITVPSGYRDGYELLMIR